MPLLTGIKPPSALGYAAKIPLAGASKSVAPTTGFFTGPPKILIELSVVANGYAGPPKRA